MTGQAHRFVAAVLGLSAIVVNSGATTSVAGTLRAGSDRAKEYRPAAVTVHEEHGTIPSKATIVIRIGSTTYRVHDETYTDRNPEDGSTYVYNDGEDAYYEPEFFLSGNQHWLFVERKGGSRISFGYLYGRNAAGFLPIHFAGGRRFDEAAWIFAAARCHGRLQPSAETHELFFDGWANGGRRVRFHLISGGHDPDFEPRATAICTYDLETKTFRLLKCQTND